MEWSIKQTAQKIGVTTDALRYYEKEGLLTPKRHPNGYRYYVEADLKVLKNLAIMKYAGFSLNEIKSMEVLYHRRPSTECNEIAKQILNSKIMELSQFISGYQKIVSLMEKLLTMIGTAEDYYHNEESINQFFSQIFDDIKGGN